MGVRKPLDLEFLQRAPKIKAERVKVLVAFGDITDFGAWTRRGSNSPEEFKAFMGQVYHAFIRFRNGNGYFVKLMGDGFMSIVEIDGGKAKSKTDEFIRHALELDQSFRKIATTTFPPPGSFRMRIVAGHVWKMVASRPGQGSAQIDYLGYPVNLAARLLEIDRPSAILCHESVKKILNGIGARNGEYQLNSIHVRSRCLRGIDPEDVRNLWKVDYLNDSTTAHRINRNTIPT